MFCDKVKEFLSQQGVQFSERNVAEDEEALAELEKLDVMTTPVTVIDGNTVVGYDRRKLEQILADKTNGGD